MIRPLIITLLWFTAALIPSVAAASGATVWSSALFGQISGDPATTPATGPAAAPATAPAAAPATATATGPAAATTPAATTTATAGASSGRAKGFPAGTFTVGGNLSLQFDRWDPDNDNTDIDFLTISALPYIGYFFMQNTAVTGALIVSHNRISIDGGGTDQTITLSGYGAQVGIYHFIPSGNFYWYVGGTVSYTMTSQETSDSDDTMDGWMLEIGLNGGILYMLTPSLGLELGARVAWQRGSTETDYAGSSDKSTTDSDGLVFNTGYIGVRAFF